MELSWKIDSKIIPVLLLGSMLSILLFTILTRVVAQDLWPYWPSPDDVTLDYRKENGTSYIDVTVTFPTTRYAVTDWGTPTIFLDNIWLANATMWYGTPGFDFFMVLHHSYDLGHPVAGEYSFIFMVWGLGIKVLNFTVSYIPGDINRDGIVNVLDLTIVSSAYGTFKGEPGYNPVADINEDGIVEMRDLVIAARNLGATDS